MNYIGYLFCYGILEICVTVTYVCNFTRQHNNSLHFFANGPKYVCHGSQQSVTLLRFSWFQQTEM